jgi:hypothetical protein
MNSAADKKKENQKAPGKGFAALIRTHQWQIIALLAIVTGVLGYYGLWLNLKPDNPLEYFKILYLTVQLFVLESILDAVDGINAPLVIAQISATIVLALTVWKTAFALFGDQIRMLSLPMLKNHVVVCGLGEKGMALVEAYRENGQSVVVLETDEDNDNIPSCRRAGAMLLIADAQDPGLLAQARAGHARCVYAITGDDGVNIEIAHQLDKLKLNKMKPKCFVHISDTSLCVLLSHHSSFDLPTEHVEKEIININNISARLLFEKHPLDWKRIRKEDATEVKLIIAGFGRMGESLAVQAARIGHFANGRALRIIAVDRKASNEEGVFLARYPQFRKAAGIEFKDLEIGSVPFFDMIRKEIGPDSLVTVAVCINDPTAAAGYALALNEHLRKMPVQIYVRQESGTGLAAILETEPSLLRVFGQLEDACTPEAVEDSRNDNFARSIHAAFVEKRIAQLRSQGKTTGSDPSLLPWEKLPSALRRSNCAQADHISIKLRAVGYETAQKKSGALSTDAKFGEKELDILSRMEHARWNAERFLDGWSLGDKKDVPNRISPHLLPWDKLPADIQAYDTEAVQEIPSLIDGAGLSLVRSA